MTTQKRVLAVIMGGGRGTRLHPLTMERCKPAVPLAGKYRLVDIPISNCINSEINRIFLLTQFNTASLHRHIQGTYHFDPFGGGFVDILSAEQTEKSADWYQGTADAVRRNLIHFRMYDHDLVLILSGDQLYKMDFREIINAHIESGADVTISAIPFPVSKVEGLGLMKVADDLSITEFAEKPKDPAVIAGLTLSDKLEKQLRSTSGEKHCLASMGIYVFRTKFLMQLLREDAADPNSSRDFGKDIIPKVVKGGKAIAHRFAKSCVRSTQEAQPYWRDVGTVDAYWEANIDLTDITPELDLYDSDWPIWTYAELKPPAKFVHDEEGRRGMAVSSLVSGDCIVSGAALKRSLIFTGARINSFSTLDHVVMLPDCYVGRNAHLSNVVIDHGVKIPEGLVVGEDPVEDARRFRVTEKGICLITQPMIDRLES